MGVLPVLSIIATAVGAGVQYSAQRRAAKAQEAAAAYNAQMLGRQADHEADVASQNAIRQSEEKRRRLATIRARAAGSGVSFTGSVVDQQLQSAFVLERGIQDDVYSSQIRQQQIRSQADMTMFEGSQRTAATRMNANAQLLGNAGGIGSQLYDGFQSGSFRIK